MPILLRSINLTNRCRGRCYDLLYMYTQHIPMGSLSVGSCHQVLAPSVVFTTQISRFLVVGKGLYDYVLVCIFPTTATHFTTLITICQLLVRVADCSSLQLAPEAIACCHLCFGLAGPLTPCSHCRFFSDILNFTIFQGFLVCVHYMLETVC
jgi:hypothetical protein